MDPSCLWLQTTIRQRFGAGDIRLQYMDHSSQFRHSSEPFLPHACSLFPVRGVLPGLTEPQMAGWWHKHALKHTSPPAPTSSSQCRSTVQAAVWVTLRQLESELRRQNAEASEWGDEPWETLGSLVVYFLLNTMNSDGKNTLAFRANALQLIFLTYVPCKCIWSAHLVQISTQQSHWKHYRVMLI